MCPVSKSLSLLAYLYLVGCNGAIAVATSNLKWLSVGNMEYGLHRLIVADALGIVASDNTSQCVVKCNMILLHNLIVANDIDGGIGSNECYFVYLFVAKEVVGYFNDTFSSYLATIEIVAYRNAVGYSVELEHRYYLE